MFEKKKKEKKKPNHLLKIPVGDPNDALLPRSAE